MIVVGSGDRHILVVGASSDLVRRLTLVLRPHRFTLHSVPAAEQVLDLVQGTCFEVVLVSFPLPEVSIVNLIRAMRDRSSACRQSGLLLLTQREVTEQARTYLNRGANRVLALDCPDRRLTETLTELLDVAPRIRVRLLVTVEVGAGLERTEDLGRIENLSQSGMLVTGTRRYIPGTEFEFEFFVPGSEESVRGKARVVRLTDPEREGVEGLGARFLELEAASRARLEQMVRRYAT